MRFAAFAFFAFFLAGAANGQDCFNRQFGFTSPQVIIQSGGGLVFPGAGVFQQGQRFQPPAVINIDNRRRGLFGLLFRRRFNQRVQVLAPGVNVQVGGRCSGFFR